MSLTKQDLAAIEKLIATSQGRTSARIETLESRMVARIDDLDDVLSLQTEHGLQEIRDQLSDVKSVVDRIEHIQQAELQRNDKQDVAIQRIREKLHAV